MFITLDKWHKPFAFFKGNGLKILSWWKAGLLFVGIATPLSFSDFHDTYIFLKEVKVTGLFAAVFCFSILLLAAITDDFRFFIKRRPRYKLSRIEISILSLFQNQEDLWFLTTKEVANELNITIADARRSLVNLTTKAEVIDCKGVVDIPIDEDDSDTQIGYCINDKGSMIDLSNYQT